MSPLVVALEPGAETVNCGQNDLKLAAQQYPLNACEIVKSPKVTFPIKICPCATVPSLKKVRREYEFGENDNNA